MTKTTKHGLNVDRSRAFEKHIPCNDDLGQVSCSYFIATLGYGREVVVDRYSMARGESRGLDARWL